MSVDIYQKLQAENEKYLPMLSKGNLAVENKVVNKSELLKVIAEYTDIEFGWCMYTDELLISKNLDGNKDLLEGQFRSANKSIHIKYLQNNLYAVVVMTENLGSNTNENLAYYEQEVFTRQDLPGKFGYKLVTYRLWYKKSDVPSLEGRWESFVQQFLGFK